MSVMADEAPGGDDEERGRKHGDSYAAATAKAIEELNNEGVVTTLDVRRYVARLMCGCTVAGETMATNVRVGSHGAWCGEHGFRLFEDFISTAPLVDSQGRT